MSPMEAIAIAKPRGDDVVMVAPEAQPPVCKIVNFGKYKYDLAKQEKERHKQKASKVKEIKFRCNIDPHDYKIKLTRAEDFLWHGDKLRVFLQFRGRQLAHPEVGMQLMERVIQDLRSMGHVDSPPRQSGKTINMMISPLPENKRVRVFRKPDEEYELTEDDHDDGDHDEDDEDDGHQDEAPAAQN
jgi:translation initiation factor IF-3